MDKNNKPKLLSLFDGSGGFPLAGLLCGIEPVAASEVEPYPIAVTRTHIPDMKHLGDVSLINGGEIAPVDIITFGSPCQDMSVAGKRDGLDGSRSNLFYEAIRIIKEMRKATNGLYPRFAVWENVPGAFSSNNGRDFHSVLEAFVQVCEPSATVPEMPKGGWPYADIIMGDGWSIAYRTYDAQYWGVPQRRRRIYLVADFGGQCAGQISFERKGLRGHSSQSGTERQGIAADAENGTDTADGKACVAAAFCPEESAKTRGVGYEVELAPTLRAGAVPACIAIDNHPADSRVSISEDGNVQTLTGRMGTGGGNTPMVLCLQGNGIDRADTANCNGKGWKENCCYTLNTIDRPAVAYSFDSIASNSMKSKNPHSGCRQVDVAKTLDTTYPDPSKNQGGVGDSVYAESI